MTDQPVPSEEDVTEVRVTWAELFFDLVFVFAVTEVSTLLRGDHSWLGVAYAMVVFVPIYWVWVGTCVYANTHTVDTAPDRLGIFTLGLLGLFMALAVPDAYHDRGVLFGASYLAARVVLFAMVRRVGGMLPVTYLVAVTVTGPLLLIGGFLPVPARALVWAAAAVTDLATPAVRRRQLRRVRFAPGHLAERFGGFLIIALGESIVAIGAPAAASHHLSAGVIGAVAAAFVLACALWWVYYVFAASAVRHALETSPDRGDIIRGVLSYGHLAFIGAIIMVAVGLAAVIANPGQRLAAGEAGMLFGGCALYLATFGYTRWRMFRTVSVTRLTAAGVVVLLSPVAVVVPALVSLSSVAAVVVGLNVYEHVVVRRRAANG
ncbi:MAG TPA: low temperature requirement protein A [Pseudonocardiaceae bacterium]